MSNLAGQPVWFDENQNEDLNAQYRPHASLNKLVPNIYVNVKQGQRNVSLAPPVCTCPSPKKKKKKKNKRSPPPYSLRDLPRENNVAMAQRENVELQKSLSTKKKNDFKEASPPKKLPGNPPRGPAPGLTRPKKLVCPRPLRSMAEMRMMIIDNQKEAARLELLKSSSLSQPCSPKKDMATQVREEFEMLKTGNAKVAARQELFKTSSLRQPCSPNKDIATQVREEFEIFKAGNAKEVPKQEFKKAPSLRQPCSPENEKLKVGTAKESARRELPNTSSLRSTRSSGKLSVSQLLQELEKLNIGTDKDNPRKYNPSVMGLLWEEVSSHDQRLKPKCDYFVPTPGTCCCDRPAQMVLCIGCSFHIKGNVRLKCPVHENRFYLNHMRFCPECKKDGLLKEVPWPK